MKRASIRLPEIVSESPFHNSARLRFHSDAPGFPGIRHYTACAFLVGEHGHLLIPAIDAVSGERRFKNMPG